jgi:DNA-binding transcriptional regulator YhcF (GntR family)
MMPGSWIKLHRSLLDDGLWQTLSDGQKVALVGLLLQVNWQETEFGCRNCHEVIKLPPGSTAKSYRALAKGAGTTPGIMHRAIQRLVDYGFISNESRTRCHTLYVVKNWEKYQADERDPDQSQNQSQSQAQTNRSTMNKKGKKGKKEKTPGDPVQPDLAGTGDEATRLADELRHHVLSVDGDNPIHDDAQWRLHRKDWRSTFLKAVRPAEKKGGGQSYERLHKAMHLAFARDSWWCGQITDAIGLVRHCNKIIAKSSSTEEFPAANIPFAGGHR